MTKRRFYVCLCRLDSYLDQTRSMLTSPTRSTKVRRTQTEKGLGISRRPFRCMLRWSLLGFGECFHITPRMTKLTSMARDTVASVGLGAPTLPFNASETFVRTFRHALAIDERRAKFMPSTWKYRKSCECGSGGRTQTDPYKTIQELIEGTSKGSTGSPHAGCAAKKDSLCWCKEDERYHGGLLTDVREVWFAGAHAGM